MDLIMVTTAPQAIAVATLAAEIWREYYTPMIGAAQVEYMLARFQSPEAIAAQIDQGYVYYLVAAQREFAAGHPTDGSRADGSRADGSPAYYGYCAVRADGEGRLASPSSEGSLFLSKIYLRASARGQGWGKWMLDHVVELARTQGLTQVYLTVNKHNALGLKRYQQWGFENAGPLVTDIGDGYVMDDWKLILRLGC